MLVLERANRAKTTKLYIGAELTFRLAGEENYWYRRKITDILPEQKSLMLDQYLVHIDSITDLKVYRKPVWRVAGGALFTFGASLAVATTAAALYQDRDVRYGAMYGLAAGSMAAGWGVSRKRTLHLGKKHRLRIIEIRFPEPQRPAN